MKQTPQNKDKGNMTYRKAIEYTMKETMDFLPNKDTDVTALISHILQLGETNIFQDLDRNLTVDQEKALKAAIIRIQNNEPLEYVIGVASFYGYKFKVTPDTLIPRIETEQLVELAEEKIYERAFDESKGGDKMNEVNVADIGTGTGCIIISLAKELRVPAHYFATDISPKALNIAQQNIDAYELQDEIKLQEGNLLEPIDEKVKFDVVIANLPYVPAPDIPTLPDSVKNYEPKLALDGGEDGAQTIKELLAQTNERLNPNAVIILELQPKIIDTVAEFAKKIYPEAKIYTQKDQFEIDRFLIIEI